MGHSLRKSIYIALGLFAFIFGFFIVCPWIKNFQQRTALEQKAPDRDIPSQSPSTFSIEKKTIAVNIKSNTLRADIADTNELRQKGLGGRQSLGNDEAMLFVFDKEDAYAFWMKDMLFPIDIAWIDSHFSIIHIEEKVSPESYPESFSPTKPALYVLETPAGYFQSHAISIGDTISLK